LKKEYSYVVCQKSFAIIGNTYFVIQKFSTKIAYNDRALCRCSIRIPSAGNRCPAFDKDKYLEPMFGDVGQARTKAAMLLMTIATTSSHTCTKPIVGGWLSYSIFSRTIIVFEQSILV